MRQKVDSLLPRTVLWGDINVLQMTVVVGLESVNFFKPPDSTPQVGGLHGVGTISQQSCFYKTTPKEDFSKASTNNSRGKDLDPTRIRMPSRLGGGCSDGGAQRLLIWSTPPLSMLLRFWVSLTSNKPLWSSHPILPPGSHSL